MHSSWLRQTQNGVEVLIYVQPNATKNEFIGEHDGRLKLRVQSPPQDGKANAAIIKFFCKCLGVAKNQVSLLRGDKSRQKTLLVEKLGLKEIQTILEGEL